MAALLSLCPSGAEELAVPVKVQVGGEPLDVKGLGHAAPFVADLDGDGRKDLLVGQFLDGKLRVYRNRGTNAKPEFEDFEWFKKGGPDGRVPTG